MNRVFIAEKPSMGRALAAILGRPVPKEGYIAVGDDAVTWCFGHLLEAVPPEGYDPELKIWRRESLPIIPNTWKMEARKDAKGQVKVIRELLRQASTVVNFGDPEREGQLIVDELLQHLAWKGHTLRLWLNTTDEKSIRKALASMSDNANYVNLSHAALARSRSDWLVGLNLTRALTLIGRSQGVIPSGQVLSVGRVQTPVLHIVVMRDEEIERFVPRDFFIPYIQAAHKNGEFKAKWYPQETMEGLDSDNRLVSEKVAKEIVDAATGRSGVVTSMESKLQKKEPPLPHTLGSLQAAADSQYGLSAQATLDIAQSLYERQFTSYPRTDCPYLKEEQFADAEELLKSLAEAGCRGAENANHELRSGAWNSAKVEAHHGIIPTGVKPSGLKPDEERIYALIAEGYICQFYPPYQYMAHTVVVDLGGNVWKASGRSVVDLGWRGIFTADDETKDLLLPAGMAKGDPIECLKAEYEAKKTTPPARYTEGTLLDAMQHVDRFVTDPRMKKYLKDAKGIGTSATQAGIIETLKGRGFLSRKGKQLVSTALGRMLVNAVPLPLKDVQTTAIWEALLSKMASGDIAFEAFMSEQERLVRSLLQQTELVKFPGAKPPTLCPECGQALQLMSSKKSGAYWACFNKAGHNGSNAYYPDDNGRLGKKREPAVATGPMIPCPEPGCGKNMRRLESSKKAGCFFWVCENKAHPIRKDVEGRPGDPFEASLKAKRGKK